MKLNADFHLFACAHFDAAQYLPSPAAGVNRFMLDRVGAERARATTIVEYSPGSKFPAHAHAGGEEFVVLEGTFKDQFGEFPRGCYVRNPIGSEHAPWVDDDGCTIMVKLLQMAETPGEGTRPLTVNFDSESARSSQTPTPFGTTLPLYHNPLTNERVSILFLDPSSLLPPSPDGTLGGEEFFVLRGALVLGAADGGGGGERFEKWGWLRFPPGGDARRGRIGAGGEGAQVYCKTGHLT
eukprot:CAMPEP_0174904028 /NCGR_PEP_ID=MMETSP0167-20121228/46683_1 /TAXON_ID=38298 /ORGANISM="Rhodella maculata, Strain CCMP736" /LENGTH=238 /DNA_ID=CAMNT_0016146533 /DNA_START=3 /DNA_END=715 /DNA_ORIENTATION=+